MLAVSNVLKCNMIQFREFFRLIPEATCQNRSHLKCLFVLFLFFFFLVLIA
jgi:hypothetical protein